MYKYNLRIPLYFVIYRVFVAWWVFFVAVPNGFCCTCCSWRCCCRKGETCDCAPPFFSPVWPKCEIFVTFVYRRIFLKKHMRSK